MRYKKIKDLVEQVIEPSVKIIKNSRKRKTMPFKEIKNILEIFFPRTKYYKTSNGFYKHVFVIHSHKRKLVLKIGRHNKDIRKDYITYCRLPESVRNRYFAKIYWRHNLFILQKYGKKVGVPTEILKKLRMKARKYSLKDVKEANVMKFGKQFKIVDAERK